jgi:transcriptional regulator with XRE-family HTH domain
MILDVNDADHQSVLDAVAVNDLCRVVGQRVRELRRGRGETMAQFAEAASISIGMLSKIEHGQTSPSLTTLSGLARAGDVPITTFFRGFDEEHDAVIVRAGTGLNIIHEGSGSGRRYQDLGALRGPMRQIEPVLVTLGEKDDVFPIFQHAGVEFIHVLNGSLEYEYGANTYRLDTGDTMQIHGEIAHGPSRLLDVPAVFLSLKVYPSTDA